MPTKLLIVGDMQGAHLGASLLRAARHLGIEAHVIERGAAYKGSRIVRKLFWHLMDRQPPLLQRYNAELIDLVKTLRPDVLIATGLVPVLGRTLSELHATGVRTMNFSTDDPFNPTLRSSWFLESLPLYDAVFTPRHANEDDLRQLGCRNVFYLPFGYDPALWRGTAQARQVVPSADVVFVGGADKDRVEFFLQFQGEGINPVLYGAYWEKYWRLNRFSRGIVAPASICEITSRAAVNICLVRRANRDSHVMRTFEIPAIGGFMIAEDTSDHRRILGPEGDCVFYFRSPIEAAQKTKWALDHPEETQRMAQRGHDRIVGTKNAYADRLREMLQR